MPYVLEVVRFITERDGPNGWMTRGSKSEHVGYMNIVFKTKQDACDYYDKHNPRMRKLNAHKTYCSDWDPKTMLFYIIRKYHNIYATIPPFNPDDATKVIQHENHCETSGCYKC